jgi:cell division protease FtsH
LKVHTRRVPLAPDCEMEIIARGTPGFSGADLENLVNEAALLAARKGRDVVTMVDFEMAKDKVLMGTERRSMIISDKEKRTTAYHEAGHALVAAMLPDCDPVHKVTIIPRGRALGLTQMLPVEDRLSMDREHAQASLAMAMGGRVAEELIFDQVTTGAGQDIQMATDTARRMVCEWGMSDKLGPLAFGKKDEQVFLGREISQQRNYSEATAIEIDAEVRRLVMDGYNKARTLLSDNIDKLRDLAEALLQRETLDAKEVLMVIRGEALPPVQKAPVEETKTRKRRPKAVFATEDSPNMLPETDGAG